MRLHMQVYRHTHTHTICMEKANLSQLLYKSGYIRWQSGTGLLHIPLERHSEVLAPFMMYLCKTTYRNTLDPAISWETVIQHKYVCSSAAIMVLFASPFETCVVDGALVHCVCVVQISIQQSLRVGASLFCRGGSQTPCKKNRISTCFTNSRSLFPVFFFPS